MGTEGKVAGAEGYRLKGCFYQFLIPYYLNVKQIRKSFDNAIYESCGSISVALRTALLMGSI